VLLGTIYAVGGLIVLGVSADQFVKGAARLAVIWRVAPVVVGAVIIGFGTSAPEMVVSGLAAGRGDLDLGVGNIIGSNVANLSLVLGAATIVTAIPVKSATLRREAPLSVASVVVFALFVQGEINRWEGALLAVLLVAAMVMVLGTARREDPLADDIVELVGDERDLSIRTEVMRTLGGLVFVVASATFLVEGAQRIAEALDLTGGFVGFTLVGVGTSAPELVTAVAAARQREAELLVGNLLGSNVFNSLAVGGVIGVVGPGPVLDSTLAEVGSVLMIGICVLAWALMVIGARVSKADGVVLIACWVISVVILSGGDEEVSAVLARLGS
jgi:cation:H+ antiporter